MNIRLCAIACTKIIAITDKSRGVLRNAPTNICNTQTTIAIYEIQSEPTPQAIRRLRGSVIDPIKRIRYSPPSPPILGGSP